MRINSSLMALALLATLRSSAGAQEPPAEAPEKAPADAPDDTASPPSAEVDASADAPPADAPAPAVPAAASDTAAEPAPPPPAPTPSETASTIEPSAPEADPAPDEYAGDDDYADDDDGLGEVLQIHGYGNWGSGVTDGNSYLRGGEDYSFKHIDFALIEIATPHPQLRLAASQFWGIEGDEFSVELDYAFGEWAFTDWLSVRMGQSPFPLGFFGEIFDVGILRPFNELPTGMYGASGFIPENFRGASLEIEGRADSGWGVRATLFGGFMSHEVDTSFGLAYTDPATLVPDPDAMDAMGEAEMQSFEVEEEIPRIGGATIALLTSVPGLELRVGGYGGSIPAGEGGQGGHGGHAGHGDSSPKDLMHLVASTGVEYLGDALEVRAEYLYHSHGEDMIVHTAYGMVGYRVTDSIQLAALGDWLLLDIDATAHGPDSMRKHLDLGIGVNYWFTREFAVKTAYHFIKGNRFSKPGEDDLVETVSMGELDDETHYLEIGTSFGF